MKSKSRKGLSKLKQSTMQKFIINIFRALFLAVFFGMLAAILYTAREAGIFFRGPQP